MVFISFNRVLKGIPQNCPIATLHKHDDLCRELVRLKGPAHIQLWISLETKLFG